MDVDDTFSSAAVPRSSIMRHRRKKAERNARKTLSLKPKVLRPRGGRRRLFSVLVINYLPAFLTFIGIKPLNDSPPRTKQQERDFAYNSVICTILFVATLATRFYRLASPAKIGKLLSPF